MRLISLTVVCLVASAAAQRGTDNCDNARFMACNAGLGTYWDTDTSMIWKSLDYMSRVVDSNIKIPYNIKNYVTICNGFSQFYACLGQFNIYNCLGTIGFMGMGMDPQTAYEYEGYLAAWRFKCGGGFYMTYQNADFAACTQSTHINYSNDMTNYITSYTINATANPSGACIYAQNLMNNIGGVYANGCRAVDQEQGRIYGCQSIREYTNAQFSHCQTQTTCKKTN